MNRPIFGKSARYDKYMNESVTDINNFQMDGKINYYYKK